jgi:hypothetical protein
MPYPGGQPSANRKPLIIGLVAAAVVIVIGVVAFSGNGNGGPISSLSASDTANAYLEALSSGDAAKALSFGNAQPANTDLPTNEILCKQLDKMRSPISGTWMRTRRFPRSGRPECHVPATWIAPYVKGPEAAPLTTDKVYLWRR